jgi:hypothetical protein
MREFGQLELRRALALDPRLEGLDGDARGDLASLGAAHPVGDDEQGCAREQRILVGAALAAGVGAGVLLGDAQHSADLEGEFAVADAHAVTRVQRSRGL